MYITDEEADKLVTHKNNGLVKLKIIGSGNHGNHDKSEKHKGQQKRSAEEKAEVAVIAEILGSNKLAGTLTDTHPTQVSNYINGKNANNKPDINLQSETEIRLGKVADKAAEKVDILLDIFATEKMDELKAAEIPTAAEKLVSIVEKIRKSTNKNDGNVNRPVVIIHAPQQQTIEQYITKEVS